MRLTLDRVWKETTKMWEWVVDNPDKAEDVSHLKQRYLDSHVRSQVLRRQLEECSDCWLCLYSAWRTPADRYSCYCCPGKLVDPDFSCRYTAYDWETKPEEFYKKLLELNRKRLKKGSK